MDHQAVDPLVQWLSTLGVGGALAAIVLLFYRKDVKQYTDLWKTQSEMLMQVVQDNTRVITKLQTTVDTLSERLDGVHGKV